MLAEQWKTMSDGDKAKYYQEANYLKNLHQLQHPDYKYSPKARKSTKTNTRQLPQQPQQVQLQIPAGNVVRSISQPVQQQQLVQVPNLPQQLVSHQRVQMQQVVSTVAPSATTVTLPMYPDQSVFQQQTIQVQQQQLPQQIQIQQQPAAGTILTSPSGIPQLILQQPQQPQQQIVFQQIEQQQIAIHPQQYVQGLDEVQLLSPQHQQPQVTFQPVVSQQQLQQVVFQQQPQQIQAYSDPQQAFQLQHEFIQQHFQPPDLEPDMNPEIEPEIVEIS